METLKIRQSHLVLGNVGALLVASVIVGVVAVWFMPTPVVANHAGAGDCPHRHVNSAVSFCDQGVAGKRKCGEDKKAICQEVKEELFGVEITTCLCLEREDEIPPTVITSIMDATEVGVGFPDTFSTLSSELGSSGAFVACSQFQTAISDIVFGTQTLMNLEMRIYHPKFLKDIDWIINNLQTIVDNQSDFASPCASAGSAGVTLPTVPVSTLLSVLAAKKQELIENRSMLFESSSTTF